MSNVKGEKKLIPLKPGLFKLSSLGKAYLIGSKCERCGDYFFPKKYVCLNCQATNLEEVALSTRGRVWSYTVARVTPPGSLITAPYVIAEVELPEKLAVMTVLTECDPESVKIGMDVELVIDKVKEDPEGNDVVSFKFKPV